MAFPPLALRPKVLGDVKPRVRDRKGPTYFFSRVKHCYNPINVYRRENAKRLAESVKQE